MRNLSFAVSGLALIASYSPAFLQAAASQNDTIAYSKTLSSPIQIMAAATDAQGNVYLTGSAQAGLETTADAAQSAYADGLCLGVGPFTPSSPCPDAFLMKLDAQGTVVYASYLGGGGADTGTAVAVDASGGVFVAGNTAPRLSGPAFPVTAGAAFPSLGESGAGGFVAKFGADGKLLYSTLLPGASVAGMAIDDGGNAYLATNVYVPAPFSLPSGGFQTAPKGALPAPLVAKLNSTGSALIYATYLSGSQSDLVSSIAVDASGRAYLAGAAQSSDFPTTNGAFQTMPKGPANFRNGFVSKLDADGASLVYSTYLSGSGGNDSILGIQLDRQGNAFVAGSTNSSDFPTTQGAFSRTGPAAPWRDSGEPGGFVTKINPEGSALAYSTYLGGVSSLAVSPEGIAYAGGVAGSGFPVTAGAAQGCVSGASDAFAATLDSQGALGSATYLGGANDDSLTAIALAGDRAVLVGSTASYDFPRVPAVRRSFAFVQPFVSNLRIGDPSAPAGPCVSLVIQNAATYYEGPLAPGELISIYGPGIGPQQAVGVQVDEDGNISRAAAGVHVLFNGLAAPLLYVQDKQINAIVPFEAGASDTTTVEVRYQGQVVKSGTWEVEPTFPGVFQPILYPDAPAGTQYPSAQAGSVISIFGTGLGQTNPPGVTGTLARGRLGHPVAPVKVRLNGVEGEVLYAGDAPTLAHGIFQINVRIPQGVPPVTPVTCTVPLTVEAGTAVIRQTAQVCINAGP
jgi:uncharacterized protein (TIGR03437 family)